MASTDKIVKQMALQPNNVRFADLLKVCTEYFGEPRHSTGSHVIFKTPWVGGPRINIQSNTGKAKTYQVKQVLLALNKLKSLRGQT